MIVWRSWILAVLVLSFSARSQSCEDSVFSEVPEYLTTLSGLDPQAASATGVLPLTNDCNHVIRYEMEVDDPKFSLNAWGSRYWIWPRSQSYVKVTCDIPVGTANATVTLTAISSRGNIRTDVLVQCYNYGVEFKPTWGPGRIEVSAFPGEERDYLLEVSDNSGGILPRGVNLTNELVETYPVGMFRTYIVSALPWGSCGGVGSESLFGGRVREGMSNLKDALLDHSYLSEGLKCRGAVPTTTTSTMSTAPCCEELEVDIRDDPNYKIFDMTPGAAALRFDFIFPLYNSNGTEFVMILPNGMVTVTVPRGEIDIEIPNTNLYSLWAAYWQEYDAVAEVGGVGNSSQYTIQWTNASILGVGEFTFQMTFYADANIAIRSDICEDQGDLIVNSLSGYQEGMYELPSPNPLFYFSGTFDLAAGYDVLRRATLSRSPNDWPSITRSPESIKAYPSAIVTLTTTGVHPLPAMYTSPIEIQVYNPAAGPVDQKLLGAFGMLVQLK